jgi:hypothetical protein
MSSLRHTTDSDTLCDNLAFDAARVQFWHYDACGLSSPTFVRALRHRVRMQAVRRLLVRG